jgi:predicted DNA-binding mobile mystery protein A
VRGATSARARRALDKRLAELRPIDRFVVPRTGWIKALRESLAMSQADLAHRMHITQAAVASMERSEASDKIQLSTLRRVANTLDCDLVYALVPRTGLESTVRLQAGRKLTPHLHAVAQTMSLEDQDSSPETELIEDETTRLIASGRLWK